MKNILVESLNEHGQRITPFYSPLANGFSDRASKFFGSFLKD